MRVAVACQDGQIFEHFGHAQFFALYTYEDMDVTQCTKRLIDVSALHGHQAMADRLRDEGVDAVIAGNMGAEAKAALLSYGIVPVAGYCGSADDAADLLVLGRLPLYEGEDCAGDCGGCSGCSAGCGEGGCSCGC